MLEYLRNAAEKPVAKILIGILAFSFVGWGVAEWIFGGTVGDNTIVRVGGEKITMQQFTTARSQQLASMSRDAQRAIYTDPAAGHAFGTGVLANLTAQAMANNRASDLGFVVTDRRVAAEIRAYPEFQENGHFSPVLFDRVLMNSGYSESDFAAVIRAQILRSMALGAVAVPVPVAKFASDAVYNARYGKREIKYLPVRFADFKVDAPTDEQLRDFYAQNPHVMPETRSVSYVLIPAKMNQPDEYDAALSKAQHVEDDIIAGDTLRAAATRHGVKFVDLGTFERAKRPNDSLLSDAMLARVFSMDAGMESELIETPTGFVIVRVDEINPQHNAEYDAVKSGLADDWRRAQQRKQAYVRANELLTAMKKGEDVAGVTNATVSRTAGAPINVLATVYGMALGDAAIAEDSDAFYVTALVREIPAAVDEKRMKSVSDAVRTASATEITDDYDAFLKRTYPVHVNDRVYSKVFSE